MTGAKSLPMLIRGANGIPFQMLGMVHSRLRTAALPAEMLNKRGRSVEIRIGSPIDAARLQAMADEVDATQYLRLRTELLARRAELRVERFAGEPEVAAAVAPENVAKEIGALPAECVLEETKDFAVCLAASGQIPLALQEIGRLREITFRAAGEGTGKPRDLDRFDGYYLHLFLWNKEKREIAGAYRLGEVQKIVARFGPKGLYTESLFRFQWGFLRRLGPAIELGRSFIRPEYQKQFAPLLLLWKGIGAFVARNPECSTMIGAVSVSNQYSQASRELIARYFEKQNKPGEWRGAVKARRPLSGKVVQKWEMGALCSLLPDMEDLSGRLRIWSMTARACRSW